MNTHPRIGRIFDALRGAQAPSVDGRDFGGSAHHAVETRGVRDGEVYGVGERRVTHRVISLRIAADVGFGANTTFHGRLDNRVDTPPPATRARASAEGEHRKNAAQEATAATEDAQTGDARWGGALACCGPPVQRGMRPRRHKAVTKALKKRLARTAGPRDRAGGRPAGRGADRRGAAGWRSSQARCTSEPGSGRRSSRRARKENGGGSTRRGVQQGAGQGRAGAGLPGAPEHRFRYDGLKGRARSEPEQWRR